MNTQSTPTQPRADGQAAHTPTPWHYDPSNDHRSEGYIRAGAPLFGADKSPAVCRAISSGFGSVQMRANAAFIVEACNSHARLTERSELLHLTCLVLGITKEENEGFADQFARQRLSELRAENKALREALTKLSKVRAIAMPTLADANELLAEIEQVARATLAAASATRSASESSTNTEGR